MIKPTSLRSDPLTLQLDPQIRNQALRVHAAMRAAIIDGLLAPGRQLPSSRALAAQTGIGRNMIVAAYEHLLNDGLIETRPGAGSFVAPDLPPPPAIAAPPDIPATGPRRPFALGQTHVEAGLLARLGMALRRHVAEARPADLAYGDPRGSAHLRRQIADWLAVNRGIRCSPDSIVVTSGTQHGLRLCADALLAPGDAVWFEDPGYGASRATLGAAGARLVPVPVDAEGLDPAAAPEPARAVYVTPSHQFPTGVTLSMRRRVALLDRAERAGMWVFEDDYDSEFRYSGPPLTALAGLSARRVIYLGTFAKTLFPGLRLGYLVLPPDAIGPVLRARAAFDRFMPVFLQDALGDLMADGTVAAHLRRMRRRYREDRDLLAARLADGGLRPVIPDQGLHMVVPLQGQPAGTAAQIRQEAGIDMLLLSETRANPGAEDGFVLGFSGYDAAALTDAADRLTRAARRVVG